ncbi:MAG: adenylyl-sulfate kinase [Betaproteobacteria bacterium]|nr:adenylyl-sulfate kinase [Betaproteobacteria bacterium]
MNEAERETAASRMRGATLLITGLPAAGKTTLGAALAAQIEGRFSRPVTLLDGDEVRKVISSDLGYSREARRLNALRHGYIAAQVCRHGGIAICALVAPYAADRAEMRQSVARRGAFLEIYLATPLAECERRDPKGLYARARTGQLRHMTGVDDPYEVPVHPEVELNGALLPAEAMAARIIDCLVERGLLPSQP